MYMCVLDAHYYVTKIHIKARQRYILKRDKETCNLFDVLRNQKCVVKIRVGITKYTQKFAYDLCNSSMFSCVECRRGANFLVIDIFSMAHSAL